MASDNVDEKYQKFCPHVVIIQSPDERTKKKLDIIDEKYQKCCPHVVIIQSPDERKKILDNAFAEVEASLRELSAMAARPVYAESMYSARTIEQLDAALFYELDRKKR